MTTFLDTSALLALLNPAEPFHAWSKEQLDTRRLAGPIIIADVVYSEFSISMPTREATDQAIRGLALERLASNDDALFRAGRAYQQYRKQRGQKTNVLPDFMIGALAEVLQAPLITANQRDFVGYFPGLELIHP